MDVSRSNCSEISLKKLYLDAPFSRAACRTGISAVLPAKLLARMGMKVERSRQQSMASTIERRYARSMQP